MPRSTLPRPMPRPVPPRPARRRAGRLTALLALLFAAALVLAGCGGAGSGTDEDSAAGTSADAGTAREEAAGAHERAPGAKEAAEGDAAAQDGSGRDGGGKRSGALPEAGAAAPRPAGAHLVRTASLDVGTRELPDALERVREVAADAGGYVGDEDTDTDEEGRAHSRLTLRIPVDAFDGALERLEDLGTARGNRLLGRTVSTEDVSEQVVDAESRVRTQRASVDRVRRLMDRAETIADVVALESELTTRQSDLEAYERQRDSLADRTAMATVTLELTETAARGAEEDDGDGAGASVADALGDGWHAFTEAVRVLLVALAVTLPFAATAAALAGAALLARRRRAVRLPATAPALSAAGPAAPATAPPAPPAAPPAPPAAEPDSGDAGDREAKRPDA